MSTEPQITMYRRASGRGRYSGITGTVTGRDASPNRPVDPADPDPAATATIAFDPKHIGNAPPAVGDRYSDATGQWWLVRSVGAVANGLYPCACQKVE